MATAGFERKVTKAHARAAADGGSGEALRQHAQLVCPQQPWVLILQRTGVAPHQRFIGQLGGGRQVGEFEHQRVAQADEVIGADGDGAADLVLQDAVESFDRAVDGAAGEILARLFPFVHVLLRARQTEQAVVLRRDELLRLWHGARGLSGELADRERERERQE